MYHFNPIDDYSLFINMQTQHFYTLKDEKGYVQEKKSFLKNVVRER